MKSMLTPRSGPAGDCFRFVCLAGNSRLPVPASLNSFSFAFNETKHPFFVRFLPSCLFLQYHTKEERVVVAVPTCHGMTTNARGGTPQPDPEDGSCPSPVRDEGILPDHLVCSLSASLRCHVWTDNQCGAGPTSAVSRTSTLGGPSTLIGSLAVLRQTTTERAECPPGAQRPEYPTAICYETIYCQHGTCFSMK